MISFSPTEYSHLNVAVLLKTAGMLTGCYLVPALCIYWLFHLMKLPLIASLIVIFFLIFILLTGFLLPLSLNSGALEPINMPVNKTNLILAPVLAIVLTSLVFTQARQFIIIGLSVFLIMNLISASYNLKGAKFYLNDDTDIIKSQKFTALSHNKNVLVLSFDGLPGYIVNRIFHERQALQTQFKDFTLFENVVASAPATTASLAQELAGNIDIKTTSKSDKDLRGNFSGTELVLNSNDYDVLTYGTYNLFMQNESKKVQRLFPATQERLFADAYYFYRYVIVRFGSNVLLQLIDNLSNTINAYHNTSKNASADNSLSDEMKLFHRLKQHKGSSWDKQHIPLVDDFKKFVSRLSSESTAISLRYMHVNITHFPVDFDEHCAYRNDNLGWYNSNQNEQGIENETLCALHLMNGFLNRLKTLGIYDNSLVILKSDHGKPHTFYSSPPYNLSINHHRNYGYDRYRPTLLIKNMNQNNDTLAYNNNLVLLGDLANTICRALDRKSACDQYPGIDLLGDQFTSNDAYYIYIPEQGSTWEFDTFKSIKLPRNIAFLQALKNADVLPAD